MNNLSNYNLNNVYHDTLFVQSGDICFYIEKLPKDIGYINLIKFKNALCGTVKGHLLKSFHIFDYLVCLYIKQKPLLKKVAVPLLKMIDTVSVLFKIKIFVEIWIIKEVEHYKCIGLYHGVPIFFKTFNSACEVNMNLALMTSSIKQYGVLDVVRLFSCSYDDFETIDSAIFEYSESMFRGVVGSYLDLDIYCRELILQEMTHKKIVAFIFLANIIVNCFTLYLGRKSFDIVRSNQEVTSEISFLSNSLTCLPNKSHLKALDQILKN